MEKLNLSVYLQIVNLIGIIIVIILLRRKKSLRLSTTSIIGKISKRILKTNYYWEFKKFFEDLPEMLPIPENPVEKINDRIMTEKEMTDGHQFFSKNEAFGLAAKMVQDKKEGLVWFENAGELCHVRVWHYAVGPHVYVYKFAPENEWDAGDRFFFRN